MRLWTALVGTVAVSVVISESMRASNVIRDMGAAQSQMIRAMLPPSPRDEFLRSISYLSLPDRVLLLREYDRATDAQ